MEKVLAVLIFLLIAGGALFAEEKNVEESVYAHIHYNPEGPNVIGHIYIGGHDRSISQTTALYVKKALDYFRNELHPIFIILELDTPGGEVFAAQKISDALKTVDTNFGIPVVAYINNWAISAGAMLAYSCRFIATVKDGSMGAAAPVTQGGEKTSEKINSAIRSDFAARAAYFDRNPLIAQAMVDADMVLVLREGKVMELAANSDILPSDQVITRQGKLLTLNAQQMVDLAVADLLLLPAKIVPLTVQQEAIGEWPAEHSLLFSSPLFQKIPQATIKTYTMDWKTGFLAFLAHPIVSSLLLLGLILGVYIELSTPGFGVAGGIALGSLSLLILSHFATETASWLEVIFLVVGIILILLEVFVIPGFGVIGVVGILLALFGLGALLLPGIQDVRFDIHTFTWNGVGEYLLQRAAWFSATIMVALIILVVLARYFVPKMALFSPLIHRGEHALGYQAGGEKDLLPSIGSEGRALTSLRGAGKVEIQGEIYDAVSQGEFIEQNQKIRLIAVEGSKLTVERLEE